MPGIQGSGNLLLVEDHHDTLMVMARLLRSSGYNVVTATAVAEAIDLAGRSPVSLVISDLGLPDGSGTEIMRELREKLGIKGIALTGFGMPDDVVLSREAGFSRHITKPVNFDLLLDAIKDLLK